MPLRPSENARLDNEVTQRIRAIAVSAPDCISGSKADRALNSCDPVSLFNACRCAASLAQKGTGVWAKSNWGESGRKTREYFLLMYSLDDMDRFKDLLISEQPNVLLIGAMTLCMPGAIECAKVAKKMLGNKLLVVLGGRHINETIYLSNEKHRAASLVKHHRASPGRLIRENKIPPVFDIIVSGEAEKLIVEIGEIFVRSTHLATAFIARHLATSTAGLWIADFPCIQKTVVSDGIRLKHDDLPSAVGVFGVTASFGVFGGRMTSHVFSYTGPGCIYDCSFCSERRSVTGSIQEIKGAPRRIYKQFEETLSTISQAYPNRGASAFVEDSTFLSGSPLAISQLCQLMEDRPLDIVFGGQFTIDQILSRKDIIRRLAKNGLRYVFVGLETLNPQEIGGMSKDIDSKKQKWQERFSEALNFLIENKISCGCALLFGLGEQHSSRLDLLRHLINLRDHVGQPITISTNWAVQHPLRGYPGSASEDYLRWGTPEGKLLEQFHNFGEASLEYPLCGIARPSLAEVQEIIDLLNQFETING
ncbi:B12-binding domain/radical SAM domain-containing protein [Pseudomonas guariconensis]|uniref:B12-binding domain/radical SAM domain-containing protein n=1 Tax=Pseudomonas TaxID=286 RepID=UPI002096DFE4|nr:MULTISPECIES: B12-binding domain/radical SAM domain-containing protein [Pseudomonas]MCO7516184.1 B12-binding domain/radical SAM domain-containing protein [Pseudomonas putida]MCO7606022.1 B12-binding domain/radical SAM domain-containing protein [Pseudomonas guariconensis]